MYLKLRIVRGLLIDRRGKSPGREVIVRRRPFLIGTAPDCQLRCASRLVARHHCAIDIERDRIVLRDEGSPSGTFLNGARVADTACLFHGDRLRVGRLELEVQVMPGRAKKPLGLKPAVQRRRPRARSEAGRETVHRATDTVIDLVSRLRSNRIAGTPVSAGGNGSAESSSAESNGEGAAAVQGGEVVGSAQD